MCIRMQCTMLFLVVIVSGLGNARVSLVVELGPCSIALMGEFTRSFFLLPVPTVNTIVESSVDNN